MQQARQDATEHGDVAEHGRGLELAQAAATLLPAFAIAAPGGPLAGDLVPEWTGAGLGLLLALPAGVLLVLRRERVVAGPLAWLGVFAALACASLLWRAPVDTFGTSRALQTLFTGALLFLSAASLGPRGRAWLARGAIVFAAWLLVPVFTRAVPSAGALGNSGSTSEAALAGAVIGLAWFTRGAGIWRWLGGGAALLLAVYAGWAPVVAGVLCLGLAIALNSGLALLSKRHHWRATGLGLACVFAFGVAWVRTHPPASPELPTELPTELTGATTAVDAGTSSADLLGGEVRLRIWRAVARMTLDYGLLGVGPGQFGAAFPPYRDPGELALSSAPELGRETEVEHAHNDWLQGFADAGLGGAAWVLFLGLVAARALRSLRDPELARSALAAAALAILANALVRSPLGFNPASGLMFAVLGAVCARPSGTSPRATSPRPGGRTASVLLFASLLLVIGSVPRAWRTLVHGRALAAVFADGDEGELERALAACPDSPQARSIAAQLPKLTGRPEDPARAAERWSAVLDVRPHRLVARMELGRLAAQAGEVEHARAAWTRAAALVPGHPVLCRNLARLEAGAGDVDAALRWLEAADDPSPDTLYAIASDAVLVSSNPEAALALVDRAAPEYAPLSPQSAWNLAQTLEASEPFRARWLEGAAHLSWAREHRANGDARAAVRSYRQAKRALWYRVPRVEAPRVADGLLLELAAALALDGDTEAARAELAGLANTRSPATIQRAPDWVREALAAAGLASDS